MELKDILDPKYQPPRVDYSDEEITERGFIMQRLENMRQQRDQKHPELDDMDFLTYYETNARAANSYIPPKMNEDDTRVVTGTTHEKEVTMLSALLNYNLESNVNAFDKGDLEIIDFGQTTADLVKKSREIEDYDSKRPLYYKEMLDQGDVYIEEAWSEYFEVSKKNPSWEDATKMRIRKVEGELKKKYGICETRMLPGTMVYLGNMKEFELPRQPDIAFVSVMPYDEAASLFGEWERFKYVPKKLVRTQPLDKTIGYQDWTLQEIQDNMVEVIRYQRKFSNTLQYMLNGVMMLPIGFPLTAISPSGEYTIVKGSIEPISKFFAISKSIPAKTKVDQAVADEMLKLIVLKTQQSYKPPMANNTKKVLSKRIWSPSTIHNDIDVTKLVPIIAPTGVTPSEFSAFQLIKSIIDEKTSSPVFSGDASSGSQTATEVLELKKQAMMKLGLAIWGVIQMEKQLTWLRIQNIMANWTQPIDERMVKMDGELKKMTEYRTVSVNTTLENGQAGRRIVQFDENLPNELSPEQIRAEEDFLTATSGVPTRKTYLNPKECQTLKYTFYVSITPTEKDSTELNRVMFTQNIRDAAAIFGIQSLNMDYLKERFASLAKEDPAKFFLRQQPVMPGMAPPGQPGAAPAPGGEIAAQMMQGTKPPEPPSLNTLAKAS